MQREKYDRRIVSDAVRQAFVGRYYPPHQQPTGDVHVAIPVFGASPALPSPSRSVRAKINCGDF
jgi:hypothetical protein